MSKRQKILRSLFEIMENLHILQVKCFSLILQVISSLAVCCKTFEIMQVMSFAKKHKN